MTASIEPVVARWEDTGPLPVITAALLSEEPPPGRAVTYRYTPRQRGTFTHEQVAGIEARVKHDGLRWWKRWREPRPPKWGAEARC